MKREQTVIVNFSLPVDLKDKEILKHVYDIEDQLDEVLERAGAGDCDGHEFAHGIGYLYLHGPSANKLYEFAKPILENAPLKPMAITLRFGDANDSSAKEVQYILE